MLEIPEWGSCKQVVELPQETDVCCSSKAGEVELCCVSVSIWSSISPTMLKFLPFGMKMYVLYYCLLEVYNLFVILHEVTIEI